MFHYNQHGLYTIIKYITASDFTYFISAQHLILTWCFNFNWYILFSVLQLMYIFCPCIAVKSQVASLRSYFVHIRLGVSGHCAANYAAFSSPPGLTCWLAVARWDEMMLHGWGRGGGPTAERRPSNGEPGKPNWQPSCQWGRGTPGARAALAYIYHCNSSCAPLHLTSTSLQSISKTPSRLLSISLCD